MRSYNWILSLFLTSLSAFSQVHQAYGLQGETISQIAAL
jgi:hypothetical protein